MPLMRFEATHIVLLKWSMMTKHDVPLVTVAVLSYNQNQVIYECLDSVLMQDYPRIELLVCDDGSSSFRQDDVWDYLSQQMKENIESCRIQHHLKNLGTVRNCNWALEHANGEFLKLLAADDRLYDERVVRDMVSAFKDRSVQVVAGRGQTQEGVLPSNMEFVRLQETDPKGLRKLLCSRPWSSILAPAVMFRTECLRKLGGFDTTYRYLEDWPLWFAMSGAGIPITMISRIVVLYSMDGISSRNVDAQHLSPIRSDYLRECRKLLKNEQERLKREGAKRLYIQCSLSERILLHREWKLNVGEPVSLRPVDFAAFFYQKMLGSFANQKMIPSVIIVAFWFVGIFIGSAADYFRIAFFLLGIACLIWNFLLFVLGCAVRSKIEE